MGRSSTVLLPNGVGEIAKRVASYYLCISSFWGTQECSLGKSSHPPGWYFIIFYNTSFFLLLRWEPAQAFGQLFHSCWAQATSPILLTSWACQGWHGWNVWGFRVVDSLLNISKPSLSQKLRQWPLVTATTWRRTWTSQPSSAHSQRSISQVQSQTHH